MHKKWKIVTFCIATTSILSYFLLGAKITAHEKSTATGSTPHMIILGAQVKPDRKPSSALQARLDVALVYLQQHPHVKVIVSGGKGADEPQSEASVMLAFLKTNGIARDRILVEDQSTTTYENLAFSKALLPDETTHLTIVTNDFHLARAKWIANDLGFTVDTLSAPTPQTVEWRLRLRERAALCKTYLIGP